MAEVTVSSNKGLGPSRVKDTTGSGGGIGSTVWYAQEESEPLNVEDYTVHGYQVQLVDSTDPDALKTATVTTIMAVYIEATNDEDMVDGSNTYLRKGGQVPTPKNFQVIAQYNINNTTNTEGIMYSDVWNFKWARVRVNVTVEGGCRLVILEKHNA